MEIIVNWLSENGLALYGAVAGTAALAISYFGHRHNVGKDSIKLAVSFAPHPSQSENVRNMLSTEGKEPWDHINLTEVYLVTVRNLGSIPAPLDDVGVVTDQGVKKQALTAIRHSHSTMLYKVAESKLDALAPRSAHTFSVYLTRDEPMFLGTEAYAVDQTGKLWSSRA